MLMCWNYTQGEKGALQQYLLLQSTIYVTETGKGLLCLMLLDTRQALAT